MRSHDWSGTALGPVEAWPQALRIAVRILLGCGYPMLICWGPKYTMLYNDAFRPVLGPRKHPGALGGPCRAVFPQAWDFIGPLFEKVMTKGQDACTLTDQLFLLERSGYLKETYFTFSCSPIPDDNDGVGGVFVTALETTDRVIEDRVSHEIRTALTPTLGPPVHAEAETERHKLREILECLPAAVGLLSVPELRWSFVNDFYVRVTGRRGVEDFLGKTVTESLPEIEGQGFVELLDEVYRTGEPYVGREAKVRLRRRGADQQVEDAYFNFVYQPIRTVSGEMQGILVHAVDVTDQVIARIATEVTQRKLQTALISSQQFAAIVESSEDAIVSKDLRGIVTSWNPAAEQIFGYTAQEMVGRSILQIIPPELQGDEQRILETIASGQRIEHFETERLTKDGRRIDVSLTISPVRNEAGEIVGAAKIARDITKRRQTEQALRMSERLASAGRLAASIAHEINNPLEGLTNLVYLARQNTVEPNTRDLLRSAEEELARISLLTRQTLGFYRERASVRTFTISSLLTPLIAAYMSRIRNKAIILQPEIRQDPETCGIAGEMRQVIANLLSNSIDAVAPGGRIRTRISAGREWNGGGRRGVRLTIADTGAGIPPETRKRVYQPFFTTKKETGTGLGLWVCHNIVEKHGGRISLRSSTVPGRSGTAFSIFLPLDGAEAAAA